AFIVSGFLISYYCGSLIIAPLSETYGRSILYKVCSIILVIFNLVCVLASNSGSLIIFRIFAG
ncbi:hypothetical protein BKA67DRAFT_496257, partial [Truncatella angustata]